jgi:hypothetical protein
MAERRYSVLYLPSSVVGEKGATNYDAIYLLGLSARLVVFRV